MTYEYFLFSMLYREVYKEESEDLSYDEMYNKVVNLYDSFSISPYDDGNVDLYSCILDFLGDSKNLIITYGETEAK